MQSRSKVALTCVLIVAATLAGGASNTRGAKPGKTAGQTLGELMTQYWAWFLGAERPGQVKNVVFIPLPSGEPTEADPSIFEGEGDVTLQVGQKFALPVFIFIGETYAEPNVPADDPAIVPREVFTTARVLVTLDDNPLIDSAVDDLSDFYFDTEYFDAVIPYDTPVEYAPDLHAVGAVWAKGLGLVHEPLPKGTHTLELFVYSDAFGFGFHNTWNITVTE